MPSLQTQNAVAPVLEEGSLLLMQALFVRRGRAEPGRSLPAFLCVQTSPALSAKERMLMDRHLDVEELLTISEVAQLLRVDATTVRRWVKEGLLEGVRLPRASQRQSYRIKRSTLERLLGEQKK
jgi:excisionase family DNA binding protein